jgi:hypothetical protein
MAVHKRHVTRNQSNLFFSVHNTKLFEQSIAHNSVLIYNKYPHEIKSVICIMQFKKMIINFLLKTVCILWKALGLIILNLQTLC